MFSRGYSFSKFALISFTLFTFCVSVKAGEPYLVKRGDTLYKILSKNSPGKKLSREDFISVMRDNPHAFPTRNKNYLLAGVYIKLPKTLNQKKYRNRRDEIYYFK